jgi:hypothetical protein
MKLNPGQLWLLKTGPPPVEVIEVDEIFVTYELNGYKPKVLRNHFLEMIKRRWAIPVHRKEKRKRWDKILQV